MCSESEAQEDSCQLTNHHKRVACSVVAKDAPAESKPEQTEAWESCDEINPGGSASFWQFEGGVVVVLGVAVTVMLKSRQKVQAMHDRRIARLVNS
jgi:hypothetical protein